MNKPFDSHRGDRVGAGAARGGLSWRGESDTGSGRQAGRRGGVTHAPRLALQKATQSIWPLASTCGPTLHHPLPLWTGQCTAPLGIYRRHRNCRRALISWTRTRRAAAVHNSAPRRGGAWRGAGERCNFEPRTRMGCSADRECVERENAGVDLPASWGGRLLKAAASATFPCGVAAA